MTIYRRDFLKATGRLAATAGFVHFPFGHASAAETARAGAQAAASAPSFFRWEQIRRDAWVVFNGGGNVLVIAEPAGAIVVDTKLTGFGALLRAEIEARVGRIEAIVMTHHHGDHSGGYAAFPGTRGIIHEAALPRIRTRATRLADEAKQKSRELTDALLASLARDFDVPRGPAAEQAIAAEVTRLASADPAAGLPAESFTGRKELRIGDTTIELIHSVSAHTDNDLFFHDRKRGIVHAGDLLFHQHHPFIDVASGGNIAGWLTALGDVRRACDTDTVVIAGHGPTGRRSALDRQAAYFERITSLVARERKAGRSREEIVKLPNRPFPKYGFVEGWSANLGIAFDQLEKR